VKEKYVLAVIEATNFEITDVITTSSTPDNLGGGNDHSSDSWNT
jgi:hypothetical protein